MRVWIAAAVVVGAGMALGEGAGTQRGGGKLPFEVRKETTRIVGPLRADGTVDYVGALNELAGKPVEAEENGFVAWVEVVGYDEDDRTWGKVLEACGIKGPVAALWKGNDPASFGWENWQAVEREIAICGRKPWVEGEHPKVAAYLKAQDAAIVRLEEAVKRPVWWQPYIPDPGRNTDSMRAVVVRYDEGGGFPTKQQVGLAAKAMLCIGKGDGEGLLRTVRLMEGLAPRIAGVLETERVYGAEMDVSASCAMGSAAASGKLDRGTLEKLAGLLDGLKPLPDLADAVAHAHRLGVLDRLQEKALDETRKGEGGKVNWNAAFARANELVDGEAKMYEMEGRAQGDGMKKFFAVKDDLMQRKDATEREAEDAVFSWHLFSLDQSLVDVQWRNETPVLMRKMARVMVGAALYRADHGKWPERLGELVPKYVKEVPVDPWAMKAGEEVRWVANEKRVEVYSVGEDGKDDGGVDNLQDRQANQPLLDDVGVGLW